MYNSSVRLHLPQVTGQPVWLPKPLGSQKYQHWLNDNGSLTQRLRRHCSHFSVEHIYQQHTSPERDEAVLLGIRSGSRALVREVYLCCDTRPVVFAHSVLPGRSLCGAWSGMARLGTRPLGEALFANPRVTRSPLAFCRLSFRHALYQQAVRILSDRPDVLWARRSAFTLENRTILVTEVFLPQVLLL